MIFLDSGEKLKMSLLEARRKWKGNNSREPADVKPTSILWVVQENTKRCQGDSGFSILLLSPSLFFSLSEETRDTESEKNHDFFILSVYSNAVVIPKLPPITLFVGKLHLK